MSGSATPALLEPEDQAEMARAVHALRHASFAIRLAELAGQPVNRLFAAVPPFAARRVNRIVESAIRKSLDVAISSMDDADRDESPSAWVPRVIAGVTGGLGGLFGVFALPVELPLTTMVMLRSIAEIGQSHGEDLSTLPSRLACLEVLALGAHGPRESDLLTYYALRATLARLTQGFANLVVEQGATAASATFGARIAATISSRFGPAVAERLAATAVPVVGLIGGATVNMVFMEHYQRLARGHFTIRRLERRYGAGEIETLYRRLVAVEPRG
jgi:EcsC protein family